MRAWPLLLALWSAPAWADPSVLAPLARSFYDEALKLEERGEVEGAILRYRAVLELEPTYTQVVVRIGALLYAEGQSDDARALYLSHPHDADVVRALGELELALGRYDAAVEVFERLWPLSGYDPESRRLMVLALARVDARRAAGEFSFWLQLQGVDLSGAPAQEAATAVAQALFDAGDPLGAVKILDDYAASLPEDREPGEAFVALRDDLLVRKEARILATAAPEPLPAEARLILERLRLALTADPHDDGAFAKLEALSSGHQRSPEVARLRSTVAEARGDGDQALAWAAAWQELAPFDPDALVRTADLLVTRHGGRYDGKAAGFYGLALEQRPSQGALWLRKAQAESRAGWPDAAADSLRAGLRYDRSGMPPEAELWLEGLDRPIPTTPISRLPVDQARGHEDYWVALRYLTRRAALRSAEEEAADLEKADRAVDIALRAEPGYRPARRLQAELALQRGQLDRARALLGSLLAEDPSDTALRRTLVDLARQQGDLAALETLIDEGVVQKDPEALVWRAREAWARWDIPTTWALLDEADPRLEPRSAAQGQARELRAAVVQLLSVTAGAGAVGVGLALGLPAIVWARRRAGVGLGALLARSPGNWRVVARNLAGIRHEVIKHHLSVLPAVAEALDGGDPGLASWVAERWVAPHGPLDRFRRYVDELEGLARSEGLRLNLRRRDPVLGRLVVAMDQVQALAVRLQREPGAREVAQLRALDAEINGELYAALGEIVRGLVVLPVDGSLIEEVWASVTGEPAFREVRAELALTLPEGPPRQVRMFKADLQEVLANLLRNAIEASVAVGAARVGVRVDGDVDDVTGLERVALRVQDQAPRRVNTAMLRSRYIDRGLGLAVDLVSRAGGSVKVEDEPGWNKAVVVWLPRVEAGEGT